MTPLDTIVVAALPAFLASVVEFVEAYTIVLAIGITRGWRAPLLGAAAAALVLAVLVAAFGVTLATVIPEHLFQVVVGSLLLLFGLRWLRKAILRFAGVVAIHDEDLIYAREVAELRQRGLTKSAFDWVGFLASFKAMLLEGLEVAFIVIALGAQGTDALLASSAGALAAFLGVGLLGAFVRQPLSRIPENTLKFFVGIMLCSFGVFWAAEGFGVEWPGEAASIIAIGVGFVIVAAIGQAMIRSVVGDSPDAERAGSV